MERTREPQEENTCKGVSNHVNLEAASPHESSYPTGKRIRVIVEKGGSQGLTVFQAETAPSPSIRFKEGAVKQRNPNKISLCHLALGPYKTLELFYYLNSEKPVVGVALNQEYGFLGLNSLKTVYLAVREALEWVKKQGKARKTHINRNIIYRKNEGQVSLKQEGKPNTRQSFFKNKPDKPYRTEVHGTIAQCSLCPEKPVIKTTTETQDEHERPLRIINYFCLEHWKREAPKTLYTKAERINKNIMQYDINMG